MGAKELIIKYFELEETKESARKALEDKLKPKVLHLEDKDSEDDKPGDPSLDHHHSDLFKDTHSLFYEIAKRLADQNDVEFTEIQVLDGDRIERGTKNIEINADEELVKEFQELADPSAQKLFKRLYNQNQDIENCETPTYVVEKEEYDIDGDVWVRLVMPDFPDIKSVVFSDDIETDAQILVDYAVSVSLDIFGRVPVPTESKKDKYFSVQSNIPVPKEFIKGEAIRFVKGDDKK